MADAPTNAQDGANEIYERRDEMAEAKLRGVPFNGVPDSFQPAKPVSFRSHKEFLAIPFVRRHATAPDFVEFFAQGPSLTIVSARYKAGALVVGKAKNRVGLEELPTEELVSSQAAADPAQAGTPPTPPPTG